MIRTLLGSLALLSTFGYLLVRSLEYREITQTEAIQRLRALLAKDKK